MKNVCRVVLTVACLLGSAAVSQANSIINGSFEQPDCSVPGNCVPGGSWGLFTSIPGWTASSGLIEIGEVANYGVTGQDGDQVLELDAIGNSAVAQMVIGAGTYNLSFLYAARAGVAQASNTFDVYWNSVLVNSFSPSSTAMTLYSTQVTSLGSPSTLEFRGTGTEDGLGGIIDAVDVTAVPDAGATAMLLGVSLLGLGYIRRRIS